MEVSPLKTAPVTVRKARETRKSAPTRFKPPFKNDEEIAKLSKEKSVLTKAVIRAAGFLGLTNNALASVLGVSTATASRLVNHQYLLSHSHKKEWEFALLLVRLFCSLDAIVGSKAKEWMKNDNSAFDGQKPIELIQTTEGLVNVCHYLDAHRDIR